MPVPQDYNYDVDLVITSDIHVYIHTPTHSCSAYFPLHQKYFVQLIVTIILSCTYTLWCYVLHT